MSSMSSGGAPGSMWIPGDLSATQSCLLSLVVGVTCWLED